MIGFQGFVNLTKDLKGVTIKNRLQQPRLHAGPLSKCMAAGFVMASRDRRSSVEAARLVDEH